MIAPEIIVVQRLQIIVHRDDAGTGGVERDGFDRLALYSSGGDGPAHGFGQGPHMVRVTLRGVVRIFLFADQRIIRRSRAEAPARAVEYRYAYAERSEIDTGDNAHIGASWGRLLTCGRLGIGLALDSAGISGRLTIGRRLATCPTLRMVQHAPT